MANGKRESRNLARFGTTQWSVVLRAGGTASDEGQKALNELIRRYWYPLYAFCRRRGNSDHDAQDLTQGFFLHLLENGRGLSSVSAAKGRFRSFLMVAFKNYMANEHRSATSVRRGGSVATLPLDEVDCGARYDTELQGDESPERLFERRWVQSLLACVRTRLAHDYQQAGKAALHELLEPLLLNQDEALSRIEIGQRLQLSVAAVNMSIHRMRYRYGEILREEVATTVDDPAEVEDELRELMAIVSSMS